MGNCYSAIICLHELSHFKSCDNGAIHPESESVISTGAGPPGLFQYYEYHFSMYMKSHDKDKTSWDRLTVLSLSWESRLAGMHVHVLKSPSDSSPTKRWRHMQTYVMASHANFTNFNVILFMKREWTTKISMYLGPGSYLLLVATQLTWLWCHHMQCIPCHFEMWLGFCCVTLN